MSDFRLPEDQLEQLARRVAEFLQAAPAPATRFADALDNPLCSARAFANAARRGDFPTFRVSRRVTALWSNVEIYMQSRPSKRRVQLDSIDPQQLLTAALASRKPRATRAA
jgi:hypothetical protein